MSIISSVGLGSGIDINGIVQVLVEAEGAPALNAINRHESAANVRLSALGKLKSLLSNFNTAVNTLKTASSFEKYSAHSSDETIITTDSGSNLVAGQYNIEVTQLASGHKLISQGYADTNAAVGKGTLSLSLGSDSFDITIDDNNNSLAGLRDAINDAQDNSGIQASIIQVDDGLGGQTSKLILNATKTGVANSVSVTAIEDMGAPGLDNFVYDPSGSGITNLTVQTGAQDAIIVVDGQTATRSTNTITDVIDGLTLNLNKINIGATVTVDVALDTDAIKEEMDSFVSSYNALYAELNRLQEVSADGKKIGALVGDSLVRNLSMQLRSVATEPVDSVDDEVNSLAMIGITVDKHGVMSLNDADFVAALGLNLKGIQSLFSSNDGVATKLDSKLEPYLFAGGILDEQTNSLNARLKNLTADREALDKRLEKIEERLMRQFIAMDNIVGQLQSTSAYLTQNLLNL